MPSFYTLSDDDQAKRLTELAGVAIARWAGRFEEPALFKYRENAVFSVRRDDGERFALRVHRADYHTDAALRSELYFMHELGRAGIGVPAVVPASDGALFVHAGASGVPEVRQIDMLGWLTGAPVDTKAEADPRMVEAYYFQLGELAAQLHDTGSRMALPPDFSRHSWDADGLLGESPVWGRFWQLPTLTPDQRALLLKARDHAKGDLAAYGKSDNSYGIIHADLIRDNVIRDDTGLLAIDFDDSGFGWYLFELATILCSILDREDYQSLQRQLFAGYKSVRPLTEADLDRLPLFMFLRASTYLGWLQTRSETQTARDMGPTHIARCCRLARQYLAIGDQPEEAR